MGFDTTENLAKNAAIPNTANEMFGDIVYKNTVNA